MEGKRIPVVEDEKIVALDIARKLEKLGYSVNATVSSGEEALESIQGDRPGEGTGSLYGDAADREGYGQ